jgi:uncharacterized repeat protein (TIGR01451 family)
MNTQYNIFRLTIVSALTVLVLLLGANDACADSPIYVDAGASGAATGLNWTDAFTNVQDALATAAFGDEIWIAEGVYYPDQGVGQTGDVPTSTFDIVSGVALYGGFPTGGGDGTFAARDWETYVTVLSGDIDQNDTVDGDGVVTHTANISGANAYHVVTTFEVTDTTVLDGFVVTAGYANLNDSNHPPNSQSGGGMTNYSDLENDNFHSMPQVSHVIFSGNYAGQSGGGMLNFTLEGPTLTDVTFVANRSDDEGGGLAFYWSGVGSYRDSRLEGLTFERNVAASNGGGMLFGGSPAISNTTFVQNSANAGGGIFAWSMAGEMNPALTDTTFLSNTASSFGGGLSSQPGYGNITLTDVTFAGNQANSSGIVGQGGGMYHSGGPATLTRVTFENNASDQGGGFALKSDGSATMNEVSFIGNTATAGGGILMEDSTLTLTHGIFAHNNASFIGGGMGQLASDSTLVDVAFSQNKSAPYAGGVYVSGGTMALSGATIANNTATDQGGGFFLNKGSVVKLANSIVWDNTAGNGGDQIYYDDPSDATVSYSDVQGCGGSASWDAACGTDGGNNIDADPRFVDAANDDLRLRYLSPAIDAGNNLSVTTSTDLAGNPRIFNGVVDMGAYEGVPDLALEKSVAPALVVPHHDIVTYTLSLSNTGAVSDIVILTDTLPDGVAFGGWVDAPEGAIHHSNAITWTGTVTAGEPVTLVFTATHTGEYGDVIANTATVSGTTQRISDDGIFTVAYPAYLPLLIKSSP